MNLHFIEIHCTDGTRTRIRADEVGVVMERKTADGMRVIIPTKVKTLETRHTLEDFWKALEAAIGGARAMIFKADEAPFPDPNASPVVPATVKRTKAA